MMNNKTALCYQCDDVVEEGIEHNCMRGLTKNINHLHRKMDLLLEVLKNELMWMNKKK